MSMSSASLPVTLLVIRHIAPECYGAFLSWMRQGVLLAAGYPGFLGSGVLQPPEGGEQYEIVLRFSDEASLLRWENSLPRRMWLERGNDLVKTSQTHRVSGMDTWFGPQKSAPPRWKQAISIWIAYFPMLLLFSVTFSEPLLGLPVFWRVLITTLVMTPVLSFICIPVITRVLHRWLQPTQVIKKNN